MLLGRSRGAAVVTNFISSLVESEITVCHFRHPTGTESRFWRRGTEQSPVSGEEAVLDRKLIFWRRYDSSEEGVVLVSDEEGGRRGRDDDDVDDDDDDFFRKVRRGSAGRRLAQERHRV